MYSKLFNNIQVTVFLASLTDGSSTGVADGESVDGSAFVERILVRKRTNTSNHDQNQDFKSLNQNQDFK